MVPVPDHSTGRPDAPSEGLDGDIGNVFLFGAQGTDYLDQLIALLRSVTITPADQANHLLKAFLQASHTAIMDESALIPDDALASFPRPSQFKTLDDLVAYHTAANTRNPAINGALLCVTQIASFLVASSSPSALLRETHMATGFCSGILPAAAVALSRTPLQLVSVGVELVRLALWIGTESGRVATEHAGESKTSWCLVIHGLDGPQTVQRLLDAFNARTAADTPLYISSIVEDKNVSVSGTPPLLDLLNSALTSPVTPDYVLKGVRLDALPRINLLRLPVYSPYHSAPMLSEAAARVLERVAKRGIGRQFRNSEPRNARLILPTTGGETIAGDDLVEALVHTILTDVNRWDLVVQNPLLQSSKARFCFVDKGARGLAGLLNKANERQELLPTKVLGGQTGGQAMQDPSGLQDDRIAVVSVSCRFPNGTDTPDKFWAMLNDEVDCCQEVPEHLFNWKAYRARSPSQRNAMSIPHGNFLHDVDKFDNLLFNMSPRESLQLDPQHRYALMCCYEAMEDAGYVPDQIASYLTTRVGCFLGAASDDYRENASSEIGSYFITGNIRAFIPGHVSFTWEWEGPSNSIDTACSSSLVALEAACDALLNRQCDSALAGGVNILTQPQMYIGLERAGLLSPSGQSGTFSDGVDGICRGDGVGVVMLKRYSTAIDEGDTILGVIRGYGSRFASLDGDTRLAVPSQPLLEELYRDTCQRARINPTDVACIDVHGLGRRDAEAVEVNAIASVFGGSSRTQALALGSVKPNIGYSEAASGMAAFVKLLKALQLRALPPTRRPAQGFALNTAFCDLAAHNVEVAFARQPLRPSGEHLVVGISNLNFFGGCSFLLLEEGPGAPPRTGDDTRPYHIVTISAKSHQAATATRDAFARDIDVGDNLTVGDISYTSTARRMHFRHRIAAVGQTWAEIAASLGERSVHSVAEQLRDDAVVCFALQAPESDVTARLSAAAGELGAHNRRIAVALDEAHCAAKLARLGGADGAFFAVAYAMANMWTRWGIHPRLVATDVASLAPALAVAGVLSLRDAARLARAQRGSAWEAGGERFKLEPPRHDVLVCNGDQSLLLAAKEPIAADQLLALLLAPLAKQSVAAQLDTRIKSTLVAPSRKQTFFVVHPLGPAAGTANWRTDVALGSSPWRDFAEGLAAMYVGGVDPDWKAYHADYAGSVRLAKLPNYQFDLQRYWMKYEDRGLLPVPGEGEGEEGGEEDEAGGEVSGTRVPHALLDWCVQADDRGATFVVDIASLPLANRLVSGHTMQGRAVIPATMYCEQAMEAATHLLLAGDGGGHGFEVAQLLVDQPYILDANAPALLIRVVRVGATTLDCTFSSAADAAKVYASCQVIVLADSEGSAVCQPVIERAVLRQAHQVEQTANVLPRALAYRLFSKVCQYGDAFQRMRSVALSHDEALAWVTVSAPIDDAGVVVDPFLLDGIAQITGFLPNVGLLDNSETEVYIASGCERLTLMPAFFDAVQRPGELSVYSTVRTTANDGASASADCYVLHDGRIVAAMLAVKSRRMTPGALAKTVPAGAARRPPPARASPAAVHPTPAPPAAALLPAGPSHAGTASPAPPAPPAPPAAVSAGVGQTMTQLREILIAELGVEEADLLPDRMLADLGLDSLMSLQVLGSMRDMHDLDLPSSLFMDYPTLRKVGEYLGAAARPGSASGEAGGDEEDVAAVMASVGTTKPLLVSGRAHIGKAAPLFLLPDGSGTGAVYMETADWGRPVYAVTSPHLVRNKHAKWSAEQLAAKYIECIATVLAPASDLILGGWSFGGIEAFETARLLLAQASPYRLLGLILNDTPDPTWAPLPDTVLDWVYGPNGNPELKKQAPPDFSPSMRSHFDSTLAALARYSPAPLAQPVPTLVVNGLRGLGGRKEDVKNWNSTVGWLQEDRHGLGAHGWERYIAAPSLHVVDIDGDHFTVCKRAASEQLGGHIRKLWPQ